MIEEIKKEIKKTFYIDEDDMHFEKANINIDSLFEILDKYKDKEIKFEDGSSKYAIVKVPELKIEDGSSRYAIVKVPELKIENIKNYNNQPDYKSAFEELKHKNLILKTPNMKLLNLEMQELENKYNLGGE